MERKFILSSESTVDLSYSYMIERDIPTMFYTYTIDGEEYVDDMGKDPESIGNFYAKVKNGAVPNTSLVNQVVYREFFEDLLKKGDVLHLAFSSGLSGSAANAIAAAEELQAEYPDRVIKVIDTRLASSGHGLILDYAADMADEGKSLVEVYEWVSKNCKKVHSQFYTTDMTHFKRTGRVSGPTATIATILNICPIMRLDDLGKIIAYSKVRGKKKAMAETLEQMILHVEDGVNYNGKCFISNSYCQEDAEEMKALIEEKFVNLRGKIQIYPIGTIIGSHTGIGTVAVFFLGDEVLPV